MEIRASVTPAEAIELIRALGWLADDRREESAAAGPEADSAAKHLGRIVKQAIAGGAELVEDVDKRPTPVRVPPQPRAQAVKNALLAKPIGSEVFVPMEAIRVIGDGLLCQRPSNHPDCQEMALIRRHEAASETTWQELYDALSKPLEPREEDTDNDAIRTGAAETAKDQATQG